MAPLIAMADTEDGELDLEAIIARFAGDDSHVSHALPNSLSKEQRQLAKKLVALHSQVVCESYVLGLSASFISSRSVQHQALDAVESGHASKTLSLTHG